MRLPPGFPDRSPQTSSGAGKGEAESYPMLLGLQQPVEHRVAVWGIALTHHSLEPEAQVAEEPAAGPVAPPGQGGDAVAAELAKGIAEHCFDDAARNPVVSRGPDLDGPSPATRRVVGEKAAAHELPSPRHTDRLIAARQARHFRQAP